MTVMSYETTSSFTIDHKAVNMTYSSLSNVIKMCRVKDNGAPLFSGLYADWEYPAENEWQIWWIV